MNSGCWFDLLFNLFTFKIIPQTEVSSESSAIVKMTKADMCLPKGRSLRHVSVRQHSSCVPLHRCLYKQQAPQNGKKCLFTEAIVIKFTDSRFSYGHRGKQFQENSWRTRIIIFKSWKLWAMPTNLLNIISKLYTRYLFTKLQTWLINEGIINPEQARFQPRYPLQNIAQYIRQTNIQIILT